MESDLITEIGIDNKKQLYVKPYMQVFPYIYRAAMEVRWDNNRLVLYSPVPREWSYTRWFIQIWTAVKEEYGCILMLFSGTHWSNVPAEIKSEVIEWFKINGIEKA